MLTIKTDNSRLDPSTSIAMYFFIDISMRYNIIEMIND
jgi:hypothetical protein